MEKTKNNIREMFNNIAQNYDMLNNIISLGQHSNIKKQAINKVPLKPNFKVLDICCGTGDITLYLFNLVPNGNVIGIDFSEEMLKIAKNRAAGKNIQFINADALNLPFKDAEFDASFISFGLRNLVDLKKGLQEMKRVTKAGGFVVNLDMGKPKWFINLFYNLYLFNIVPILGKLFKGNPSAYKYLPESTKDFPNGKSLVKIFKEIGLTDVKKFDYLFGAISQQIGKVN